MQIMCVCAWSSASDTGSRKARGTTVQNRKLGAIIRTRNRELQFQLGRRIHVIPEAAKSSVSILILDSRVESRSFPGSWKCSFWGVGDPCVTVVKNTENKNNICLSCEHAASRVTLELAKDKIGLKFGWMYPHLGVRRALPPIHDA